MKNLFVLVLSLAIVFAVSCNVETEHQHSYVEKTVAPTCTEDGKTYKECSTCGDIIETKVIPARHSEDWVVVVDKEPTEEEKGTYIYICPNCKEIMDTVIRTLYPAEVFVPTDAKLEKMDDSLLSFMSGVIYQSTYPYAVNKVLSNHLVIDNAVFKENTTFQDNIETKTYTVRKGNISLINESQETADLPFTITVNGTITQVITVDEKNYDVFMNFNNATFDNKKNPKLVDADTFSYEIKPEASGISDETILDEAWNLLYDLIITGNYLEVFSDCEIESHIILEYKDKTSDELMYKSSTIHLYDEKGKKFERAYSKGMTKVDEEEHNVAFGYSFPLNFDYIQIDGKFYDPEEINNFIAENWDNK